MIFVAQRSDILGAFASVLCLIHCIATPFIFIAQASTVSCCNAVPAWWKLIDYIFLTISFFAIYWTSKTTTINFIKPLLWLSWFALLTVILNERFGWFPLAESAIYIPAFSLVILHLYNKKYCKCGTDKCCVDER